MVQRPLAKKKIVVTRPKGQADETVKLLESLGGEVVLLPMVRAVTVYDEDKFDNFLGKLVDSQIDYLIFMSVNGAKSLISIARRFKKKARLLRSLRNAIIVAVGKKTAAQLIRESIGVDIIPEEFSSAGIMRELSSRNLRGKLICIPRTSAAGNYLADRLTERGATVEQYHVYETKRPKLDNVRDFVNDLRNERIWCVIFTSPSTVENFFILCRRYIKRSELIESLNKAVIATIGPVTGEALAEKGITVDVVPRKYLASELVRSIVDFAVHSKNAVKSA